MESSLKRTSFKSSWPSDVVDIVMSAHCGVNEYLVLQMVPTAAAKAEPWRLYSALLSFDRSRCSGYNWALRRRKLLGMMRKLRNYRVSWPGCSDYSTLLQESDVNYCCW